MSPIFIIKWLTQQTELRKLEWHEQPMGGFAAAKNGVHIVIKGGELMPIRLTFSTIDGQITTVHEPRPHLSEAPIGKTISFVKKHLGFESVAGPQTEAQKLDEAIRVLLQNLEKLVVQQILNRDLFQYERRVQEKIFKQLLGSQKEIPEC